MTLPLHKRYEIVFLHEHPKVENLSFSKIAAYIGCSKSTVIYWVQRWQISKDLTEEPKSGRKRSTTAKQDERIVKMAKTEHNITSTKIQGIMEKKGVDISARTIRRRLHESGGKYTNEISKPLLSENHRKKRLEWAKLHQNFDWNRVIFTDESTFQIFPPKKKVWQFGKRKKICRTVKHSAKVHVWGCFSALGFGKLVCFRRNLNGEFMCKVYEQGLLPSSSEFFGAGNLDWFLQEDNDPKHRSKIAQNWKAKEGISVLPWPSMSPDQNPIENVWQIMKLNIAKKKIRSIRGLLVCLSTEWNRLSPELATKLVDSMQRRVTALLESQGDYTMY